MNALVQRMSLFARRDWGETLLPRIFINPCFFYASTGGVLRTSKEKKAHVVDAKMQDGRVPAVKAEDLVGVLYHCVSGEVMNL